MRIQSFSVLVGSLACNARCPYCIAKMTPAHGLGRRAPRVNWRNFDVGCRLAKASGVRSVILTGKGEPTLFPGEITRHLQALKPHGFPLIELHTNGLFLGGGGDRAESRLKRWFGLGLTTVAVSVAHHEPERNRRVFCPGAKRYMDLPRLINRLHGIGFSVRLTCVLAKGLIDGPKALARLIAFARANRCEQLTVMPARRPRQAAGAEAARWVREHAISNAALRAMARHLERNGTRLLKLMHGAVVYDVEGQNVCLTDCLTREPETGDVRQLIFFPDGHLRYDWESPAATLL